MIAAEGPIVDADHVQSTDPVPPAAVRRAIALRILVNSAFGNVLVAIRGDAQRATMLRYDVRKYQLGAFVVGSALAGLSGVLYKLGPVHHALQHGHYRGALPLFWVAVGGRNDLTTSLVGAIALIEASRRSPSTAASMRWSSWARCSSRPFCSRPKAS